MGPAGRVGGQTTTPMRANGYYAKPLDDEQYGNSGVNIYDRYEVQTISTNVQYGQPVVDAPPSPKTQLTPGWAYKVPQPAGQPGPINYSAAPGQWNRMVIEFTPPVLNATKDVVVTAAKLKVTLQTLNANGTVAASQVSFGGAGMWELKDDKGVKLKGTASRQISKAGPLAEGSLFLQSHWGSLVEFRNPTVTPARQEGTIDRGTIDRGIM